MSVAISKKAAPLHTGFEWAGDTERARRAAMEAIWADPRRPSLAERADAASKAQAGGLTWRKTMETVWGFSPQEIAELEADRATEALQVALLAPSPNGFGSSPEAANA